VRLGALALLLLALGPACKTYKDELRVPAGSEAGTYEPPPGRQVYGEAGVIVNVPDPDGAVIVAPDAAAKPDRALADQAGSADQAPAIFQDAAPATQYETGSGICDLLAQTCGAGFGCFPAPGGLGRCLQPDPGTSQGVGCGEPSNCAAGLTCADGLCTPLCATAQPACVGGARCVALPAYIGVGYCLP
jgi:hypothetical protein